MNKGTIRFVRLWWFIRIWLLGTFMFKSRLMLKPFGRMKVSQGPGCKNPDPFFRNSFLLETRLECHHSETEQMRSLA